MTIYHIYLKMYNRGYDCNAVNTEVILKLNLYDMVDLKKEYDGADNALGNHFSGWLMP